MAGDADSQHVGMTDRQRRMERALSFYVGNPPKPLIIRAGQPDDNVLIGLARLVVDKGASFLFGQDVTAQVTSPNAEQQQTWLDECWRRNHRRILLLKLATNGGLYGHAFIRILDDQPFPRLIVLDPKIVSVETDPDDCDMVWEYVITPPPLAPVDADDKPARTRTVISSPSADAGYRVDGVEGITWTITDQEWAGGTWVTSTEHTWPYDFPPIVDCQNLPKPNDLWGESDLPEDVLLTLADINRVASHYSKIIRLHAHPKIWSRGMGAQRIDAAIDSVIHLPSETAELRALEMQSDLSSTMAFFDKLLNLLSMMVRVPLVAMGMPDNLGAISGVALQIRYQPLIEKTEAKRLTYGDMLSELDRRLLILGGFDTVAATDLQWPNILPSDPLMERQVWVLDESLGLVSKQTLSDLAGYDYDTEQDNLEQEKQDALDRGLVPPPAPVIQPDGEVVAPPAPFGGPGTTVSPAMPKKG